MEITQLLFEAQKITRCVRIADRKSHRQEEGARTRSGRGRREGRMDLKKSKVAV